MVEDEFATPVKSGPRQNGSVDGSPSGSHVLPVLVEAQAEPVTVNAPAKNRKAKNRRKRQREV